MKVQPLFTLDDETYTVKATSAILEGSNILAGDTLRVARNMAPADGNVVLVEHEHDCYLKVYRDGHLLSTKGPPIKLTPDMKVLGVVIENLSR